MRAGGLGIYRELETRAGGFDIAFIESQLQKRISCTDQRQKSSRPLTLLITSPIHLSLLALLPGSGPAWNAREAERVGNVRD